MIANALINSVFGFRKYVRRREWLRSSAYLHLYVQWHGITGYIIQRQYPLIIIESILQTFPLEGKVNEGDGGSLIRKESCPCMIFFQIISNSLHFLLDTRIFTGTIKSIRN